MEIFCSIVCGYLRSSVIAMQVIMYDEPTAGLDPVASTVVEDLIRSLHRSVSFAAYGPQMSRRPRVGNFQGLMPTTQGTS